MRLEKFLENVAAYYLTIKNKYGVIKADAYLKDCFIKCYMVENGEELAEMVYDYINKKYLEDNILGTMEQYVNNNEVDAKKAEELMAIMEELI